MRDETSVKRYLNQFDKEKIIELYIQQRFDNRQELWEKSKEIEQLKKENEELKAYNKQLDYWKSEYYNSYDEIRNDYNDLKSSQNKLAIEKLEEVKEKFYDADFYQKVLLPMLAELKGGNDE